MNQPTSEPEPLKIVEIDDEGWAAFKKREAGQRREYSQSEEAVQDHEAWVNAPMADDDDWGSIPDENQVEPEILPNPDEIPWDELYDWSLETSTNESISFQPPADER